MSSDHPPSADERPAPIDPNLDEFQRLMRQARAGDQEACRQLYERFQQPVLRAVRRLMYPRLRTILDSTDLTQEVWLAVFTGAIDAKDFLDPARFVKFLEAVAENKTIDRARREIGAQKRSLNREEPFGRNEHKVFGRPAPAADPAEQAAAADALAALLAGLSERERSAVAGLRNGEVSAETAGSLGLSPTALRLLLRSRLRVRREQGAADNSVS